ncbi:MAG: DNA-binding response regulator [Elusimicrobia bacterium CG11_big_fil_rev_8_21_14_0_20_64_6]|nr:MAG: DNA-binding response regulator [Elusimicrobia bacterium CG11_big_fil_rev_8_21_14_0_20_64_6]
MTSTFKFLAVTPDLRRLEALRSLLGGAGGKGEAIAALPLSDDTRLPDCAALFMDADAAPEGQALRRCRELRSHLHAASFAIILFGSGRGGAALVEGLDAGADDFWQYPFKDSVCLAYLRAILRRLSRLRPQERSVLSGTLSLDPSSRTATLGGKELVLRSKEFDLLYYLLQHQGTVVRRDALLQAVWDYPEAIPTRTVDFHVSQLRRKLGRAGKNLETVTGMGYRFRADQDQA